MWDSMFNLCGGPDQQGMWLAEMAEIYPHVDCVGIDIVAQQHE
jgi:hypothetical protein